MVRSQIFVLAFISVLLSSTAVAEEDKLVNRKETIEAVHGVGGCCGPVGQNCGQCIPNGEMPGLGKEIGCCLPVKAKSPEYSCCKCGIPSLNPTYGAPCCAGNC